MIPWNSPDLWFGKVVRMLKAVYPGVAFTGYNRAVGATSPEFGRVSSCNAVVMHTQCSTFRKQPIKKAAALVCCFLGCLGGVVLPG